MAPVRADRDALLRNWKSAAAEIAADVTTLTAEAEALGPVVSEKWVAGEDAVALAPRLDALLARAGDAERRARALAAALGDRARSLAAGAGADAAAAAAAAAKSRDGAEAGRRAATRVAASARALAWAARGDGGLRARDDAAAAWLAARYAAREAAAAPGAPLLGFLGAAEHAALAPRGLLLVLGDDADDAALEDRLGALCYAAGDVAFRLADDDAGGDNDAVGRGLAAVAGLGAALRLDGAARERASSLWALDLADGLEYEKISSDARAAALAFAAASLAKRSTREDGAALRVACAARVARLARLAPARARSCVAALDDGDAEGAVAFAVARADAARRAGDAAEALAELRAVEGAGAAAVEAAKIAVYESLWAGGRRDALAALPATYLDEAALAKFLASVGDAAAADVAVSLLLKRRRLRDALALEARASPAAGGALAVARAAVAAEGGAPPATRCPYAAAFNL